MGQSGVRGTASHDGPTGMMGLVFRERKNEMYGISDLKQEVCSYNPSLHRKYNTTDPFFLLVQGILLPRPV